MIRLAQLSKAIRRWQKPKPAQVQAGARAGRDQTHNYMGVQTLDPSRLASAFAAADTGFIDQQALLFGLIEEHDAHLFAELGKRRRAVTGLGWHLEPPRDASQAEINHTEALADMLRNIPRIEDALYDLTDAIGKGLSAHQIEWRTGNEWVPGALHFVPTSQLRVERDSGQVQYVNRFGQAEALRPMCWMVHEHRALSGYIERAALFRVLAWIYAYKAYNSYDMQRFLERYGLPLRLGKYPAGMVGSDRDELLKAVRNIGSDGAGIVPSTMSIEFVQAAKQGTVRDFLSAIEYWERKQSLAILGGTLTSQADGKTSTNALGSIHNAVRREIMLHDVRQIEPTLQRDLLRPIALLNGLFVDDRLPRLVFDTQEAVDQAQMVDVLARAVALGMQIDLEYAHQVLQIPRAGKDAEVLRAAAPAPDTPAALSAALSNRSAAKGDKGEDALQLALDEALDDLLADGGVDKDWVQQIVQDLQDGADDPAILQRLAEAWPDADDDLLQERLASVIFVAETLGRLEQERARV